MRAEDLLCPGPGGLYSPLGGFHVDPTKAVPKALITHGHSDHARPGHEAVLATAETLAIMEARYGADFARSTQAIRFHEPMKVGGATVTFVPAGHVLGSAQIVVEHGDCRVVASGDYKRQPDSTCAGFEPVECDVFITEATFGLPVFRHPDAAAEIGRLIDSLALFPERTHLIGAYSLGKTQRVIRLLRDAGYDKPIYLHGASETLCRLYESQGVALGPLAPATDNRKSRADFAGEIVIGPSGSYDDRWSRRFADPLIIAASGWMRVRQRAKQGGVELPLVISDHSDWDELCRTIRETGAGEVWVTHGREEALVHWCRLNGIPARPLHLVGYEDEEAE
ncbi:MAG: ligase-associated DNA damage response exonuclease [Bauldia sp.]|nr:ligase-associated DNA damage response exonuclease [Bauldia sp.]